MVVLFHSMPNFAKRRWIISALFVGRALVDANVVSRRRTDAGQR